MPELQNDFVGLAALRFVGALGFYRTDAGVVV